VCLAVPGQIISIDELLSTESELPADALLYRMGKVSFGGIIKRVSLAYVPEAIRTFAADCCGLDFRSSEIFPSSHKVEIGRFSSRYSKFRPNAPQIKIHNHQWIMILGFTVSRQDGNRLTA
jgi:hydrogenase maturation factor